MRIFVLPLIFLSHTIFAMNNVSEIKQAGSFNKLSRELQISVFGLLKPKEFNNLRSTCKIFSEFFSFTNPSPIFIRQFGRNLCSTDILIIKGIAIRDEFHELENACKACLIKTSTSSYPYSLFYY